MFPNNQLINLNDQKVTNLRATKLRLLKKIILKIPELWGDQIEQSDVSNAPIFPFQTINLNGTDVLMKSLSSNQIYSTLILDKIRLPRGLLRWCEELHLSDSQIKTSFTFARNSSSSVFDQVFQYKIVTQILPTNEYLKRYRASDSEMCGRCLHERDTVLHSTWLCNRIVPYIVHVFEFLETKCKIGVDIKMMEYIFGFQGRKFLGLNHILLELKKEIFYNWRENVGVATFFNCFKQKIMHLIVKEKQIAIASNKFEAFAQKWLNYVEIYDFLGPDCQIIS